jgi:zinc transport system ATP-binding protein
MDKEKDNLHVLNKSTDSVVIDVKNVSFSYTSSLESPQSSLEDSSSTSVKFSLHTADAVKSPVRSSVPVFMNHADTKLKTRFINFLDDKKDDTHRGSLLHGLNFSIKAGSFVALLGANGTGKTTLIKLLLGKLVPQVGSISIHGQNPRFIRDWSKVGYVPQRAVFDRNHPATVKELVVEPKICEHLGIRDLFDKQFKQLSGGQQQKVLVALALRHNPDLLILDEPTVGMDERSCKQFYDVLDHLRIHHNKTIVLVTHDVTLIDSYATHILCIDGTSKISKRFSNARCVHD